MHTNRGIVIGVLCEGTLVDEYAHQSEDEYTASCFIPGDANKTFEIYVANDLPAQDVSISIRIDGTFIGRYFLTGRGKNVLPGLYVSDSVTKPFCFRELKIPDEQTLRDPRFFKWENMGLMEFCVYRCVRTSSDVFRSQTVPPSPERTSDRHDSSRESQESVATGPERPIPKIEGVQGVTIDPPNEPFARVIFRYRPQAALQAQGIIRSSPVTRRTPRLRAPSSSPEPQQTPHQSPPIPPITPLESDRPTEPSQVPTFRQSPYAPPPLPSVSSDASPPVRVPSRARSVPEQPLLPRPATARNVNAAERTAAEADADELAHMKAQLANVYDDMQRVMQQIRGCVESVGASMRQLRVLQWQVDVLERGQRESLQQHPVDRDERDAPRKRSRHMAQQPQSQATNDEVRLRPRAGPGGGAEFQFQFTAPMQLGGREERPPTFAPPPVRHFAPPERERNDERRTRPAMHHAYSQPQPQPPRPPPETQFSFQLPPRPDLRSRYYQLPQGPPPDSQPQPQSPTQPPAVKAEGSDNGHESRPQLSYSPHSLTQSQAEQFSSYSQQGHSSSSQWQL